MERSRLKTLKAESEERMKQVSDGAVRLQCGLIERNPLLNSRWSSMKAKAVIWTSSAHASDTLDDNL